MQALSLVLALGLALGPAAAEAPAEVEISGEAPEPSETPDDSETPEAPAEVEAPATDAGTATPAETPATGPEAAREDPAPVETPDAPVETPDAQAGTPEAPADTLEPPPAGDASALAASTEATTDAAPRKDRLGCGGSRPCRRMSIAGIVIGTLGLASVGAGIGLLLTPDAVIEEDPIFVSSTRPPGLVTVTVGTGVVLTSVLMLVAAHRGYKQRPDEQARLRWSPGGVALRF